MFFSVISKRSDREMESFTDKRPVHRILVQESQFLIPRLAHAILEDVLPGAQFNESHPLKNFIDQAEARVALLLKVKFRDLTSDEIEIYIVYFILYCRCITLIER